MRKSSTGQPPASTTAPAKSVPVGGIVAGAVVGAIAIAAIFAFAWYFVKVRRPRNSTRGFVENFNAADVGPGVDAPEKSINADLPDAMRTFSNPVVREPVPSGRIQYGME